uniref:Putative secreted protein n=1 Tax=Anopheles marajoara TaxID=58244 RepID=A0A2M4CBM6_9DIPT
MIKKAVAIKRTLTFLFLPLRYRLGSLWATPRSPSPQPPIASLLLSRTLSSAELVGCVWSQTHAATTNNMVLLHQPRFCHW